LSFDEPGGYDFKLSVAMWEMVKQIAANDERKPTQQLVSFLF
jgi:hypothetical protein